MVGMLLDKANRSILESSSSSKVDADGNGAAKRLERLGPADVRGACVWGNHSNSQVRAWMRSLHTSPSSSRATVTPVQSMLACL